MFKTAVTNVIGPLKCDNVMCPIPLPGFATQTLSMNSTWICDKDLRRRTCVERQRVDEGAGNLLCGSFVPQGEVIGVEHPLFVFGRQEVS